MRGEEEAREERIHVDAQAATDDGGGAGGDGDGFADAGEQGTDLFVEATALGGEDQGARGPVEEADADAGLEAGDGPADGGLSDAERRGGADEAACFDDGSEYADAIEKTIVEGAMRGDH